MVIASDLMSGRLASVPDIPRNTYDTASMIPGASFIKQLSKNLGSVPQNLQLKSKIVHETGSCLIKCSR